MSTNANWHCSTPSDHRAYAGVWGGVNFKTCIVKGTTSGAKAQAVLVIQNKARQHVYIEKGRILFESGRGGDVWCAASNLAPGATAGCFGPSVEMYDCETTTAAETWLTLLGKEQQGWKQAEYTPC
ncbi:hypothetical protein ACF08N_33405 [Streptomyces sp. NPDC015127]|uniref:hypothetical protein n=1 Tax=Streptomyces sp. NPDC015127 TaxID=3364939 RepID=UPI0036F95234